MKTLTIGNNRTRVICLVLILIWLAVIFIFSAQPATLSESVSTEVSDKITEVLTPNGTDTEPIVLPVRNYAHFFEFALLGGLILIYILHSTKAGWFRAPIAFGVTSVIAVLDELHQELVPGRAAMPNDIINDCIGAGAGVLITFIILIIKRRSV